MFSIFRESSGLTFIFINATKQYLKSWVSISLFNALFKSRDVPMIHSKLYYPVNLVHIFPTPFFRQRLYKLDSGGHGCQAKGNSYRTGEFIVRHHEVCVSDRGRKPIDDSAFRCIMFPDHYFPGKRRTRKTARSQFYRTGIVLCDDLSVRPCT